MRTNRWTRAILGGLAGGGLGLALTIVPVVGVDRSAARPEIRVHSDSVSSRPVTVGWSAVVAAPANLVGVRWNGDPTARFMIEARTGSRWRSVIEVGDDGDHRPDSETVEAARAETRRASDAIWVGDATAVRVRLREGNARDVTIERVLSPRAAANPNAADASTVAMPGIISRPEWGANENLRLANCPEPPDISTNAKIGVVHHTAGSNNYGPGDTAAIVRGLYGYATQTLKYCDTHYNFFVDRYGQIFEGRFGSVWDPVRAAHATGMNTGSVGVAVIGNFSATGVPPATVRALESLLAWKLNWHGVDPTRPVDYTTISGTDRWPAGSTHTLPFIVGHRDPGVTDCPGAGLYSLLPSIRNNVTWRILGGGADGIYAHTATATNPKLAVVSRYGVVYPAGGAGELRASAVWPGWSIARDIELTAAGAGGYTLDGFGGLHRFGTAPPLAGPYWPGWDIARDVVLRPNGGGWTLDGFGGIHAFGGAPKLGTGPYFPGFDVARKLVQFSNGWYVLDAFGALHPVGGSPSVATPYWPGWPIVRDVQRNPDGSGGYILDGFGGIWRVGGAPALVGTPYFGRDVARGFVVLTGRRGYTVRDDGYLARFGGAPVVSQGRNTWVFAQPITTPWVIAGVAGK